ncbi:hypothetical protein CTAYLR_006646 [Chrysophaeum taylorii]|uniref:Structure-specific endonuclease subunit SLX1 homolog n=1 Tax=Chrysophaeum taylorii TaxID=2483200 RepID=A0AAD7XNS6_9STRA|nr:hypothetical protein CTAYLR_006646 [Chrysophaeum taylorii]
MAVAEEELDSRPFCGCYLLRSLDTKHPMSTYIGFTVHPLRRIRQHNGEISGGAWKTKGKRPWAFAALVHGFGSQAEALQFEWAWQHPTRSKAVKQAADLLGKSTKGRRSGWRSQFDILATMLTVDKWTALRVRVPDPDSTPVPEVLEPVVTLGSVESWQPAFLAADPRNAVDEISALEDDEREDGAFHHDFCCSVCGGEDASNTYETCTTCGANAHAACLVLADGDAAQCPICGCAIQVSGTVRGNDRPAAADVIDLTTPLSSRQHPPSDDDDVDDDVDDDIATVDLCTPSPVHLPETTTPLVLSVERRNIAFTVSPADEYSVVDLTRSVTPRSRAWPSHPEFSPLSSPAL